MGGFRHTGPPARGGASPVLAVLGGQRSVQLLNDAAGGQRPVDSGEMRRPRGRRKLSSEGRVSTFPARALKECGHTKPPATKKDVASLFESHVNVTNLEMCGHPVP